jgi:eukaryotic-like serine/threonine-protein kinase
MADEPREDSIDPERTIEEETVEVRRGIPEPEGYPYDGDLEADAVVVQRSERERRNPDGTIDRDTVQVEERRRRSRDPIAIALGVLLLLLAAGAVTWYFLAQEDTTPVPGVEGLQVDQAVAQLEEDGFRVSIATEASDAAPGTVFAQDPGAGAEADEGSTVAIRVSAGPDTIAVPNAVGLAEAEARDRLVGAGFQVESKEVFAEREPGTVTAQSPSAGAEAERGATVTIDVSKGSGLVEVPNVVGMTRGQAEAELSTARLEANVVEVPSDEPVGTVVAQNPVGGQVQQGTAIRLNVSAGR